MKPKETTEIPVMVTNTRLGKYTYCPQLKKLTTVSCSYTKKQCKCVNLPRRITCELSNIIYLITCSKYILTWQIITWTPTHIFVVV